MSNNVRVELNLRGINEMMRSEGMQAHLRMAGEQVASAAGAGYKQKTKTINWIAVSNIYPETYEASQDNLENNTLLKALGSAGLSPTK